MNRLTNTLGRVRVAAPCGEDWGEMRGDERVRFCRRCSLNVYNLSAMTRREAERLVVEREGRLCVRFYRRRDGTILTKNCPTGLIKLKRRVSRVASAAAAAAVGLFAGVASAPGTRQAQAEVSGEVAVALAPPEPVADVPAVLGRSDFTDFRDPKTVEAAPPRAESFEAEAFDMSQGMMAPEPAIAFAPFLLGSGLFTLLTLPLVMLGCRDKESDGEGLRIWSNEWSLADERAALPRAVSVVDPDH